MKKLVMGLAVMAAGVVFGFADARIRDFPRLAGETDDAPRFRRAIESAANGVLEVGKGDYEIASPLTVTNRCSIKMHPAAILKATAKMDFVLTWDGYGDYHSLTLFNPDGSVYDNLGLFIRGGEIDGNGLASCLRIGNGHHFTLADITLRNGKRAGLELSRWNGGHLYELIANNVYCKCSMKGLSGNVGIDVGVNDCHFTDIVIVDYTVGIRINGGSNRLTRCHIWGGTVPPKSMGLREWSELYGLNKKRPFTKEVEADLLARGVPEMLIGSTAFEIHGGGTTIDGCYADTAEIGFLIDGSAIISHSGFFNNPKMGLRKSTAIVHKKGRLIVNASDFNGAAGCERLYEGSGKDLIWQANHVNGGKGMAEEARKLAGFAR